MNPKVDFYFDKATWHEELTLLRTIVLDCGLTEELKWGCPCYTLGKANIVLIHVFKEYCALLFFKGVLMNDADKILIQQTENVQAGRQIRFTNAKDVMKLKKSLKAYVFEAIEIEKAGLKVVLKPTKQYDIPEEFESMMNKNSKLKKAFYALTPGRQRAYLLHFSQAKQSATRTARVEKNMQAILDGKGLKE